MGHFAVHPKAVLLLDLNAEQMSTYMHSPMWNRIIAKWCEVKKSHTIASRAYDHTSWEEVMAEPLWFNPMIPLPGLYINDKTLDGTSRSRWDPIALMQFHTLRDLWDDNLKSWANIESMQHWAPQFFRNSALTSKFYRQLEQSLTTLTQAIPSGKGFFGMTFAFFVYDSLYDTVFLALYDAV